jgi:hypothetical protein
MYVVVMFEPARPNENLKLTEQINEVFGIFKDDEEAYEWTKRANKLIKEREWLIIPLSDISSINSIDPSVN